MCLGCGATDQEGVVFTCSNAHGMGLCRICAGVPLARLVEKINTTARIKMMAVRQASRNFGATGATQEG